jgi:hypothetical protein
MKTPRLGDVTGISGSDALRRFLALGFAVVQLLSPGAAAIADGLLAQESAEAPTVHVESKTGTKCPSVHSPDCGLCRHLTTHTAWCAAPDGFTARSPGHDASREPQTAARSVAKGSQLPRGPPRFS